MVVVRDMQHGRDGKPWYHEPKILDQPVPTTSTLSITPQQDITVRATLGFPQRESIKLDLLYIRPSTRFKLWILWRLNDLSETR